MTAFEIREELANRYNLEIRYICCHYCKYWDYNRGKALNSQHESRCAKRVKDWTWAREYCRGFVPNEKE
nr:MAG TPA: hypothetical protein [Caudoviricetes sp.]